MTSNAIHQLQHETIAGVVNYSESINHSCFVLELAFENE